MPLKGEGDIWGVGGKGRAVVIRHPSHCCCQGLTREYVCLKTTLTSIHYNMIGRAAQDRAQCHFTHSSCHVCQDQRYREGFFRGHFLSLPVLFLSLDRTHWCSGEYMTYTNFTIRLNCVYTLLNNPWCVSFSSMLSVYSKTHCFVCSFGCS